MSRVGQKPIEIPAGVTVDVKGAAVTVKGKSGELHMDVPDPIKVEVEGSSIVVTRPNDTRKSKSFHGLVRSLLNNMVEGVSKGFTKELEIQGVGFKAAMQGRVLSMSVGYSSPVEYEIPEGVEVKVDNGVNITVSGPDKQKVGDTAARIKAFCPAEPYKGKGVMFKGERIRRKVGKTVA